MARDRSRTRRGGLRAMALAGIAGAGAAGLCAAAQPGVSWAADAAAGLELSRTWCAACHLVEEGQAGPGSDIAPFTEVARDPDFDPDQLAAFLAAPHPKMPDMSLTRREIADIGAYIASLRRP
ncbi:cytochrome c [Stappia sp. TSB10GB4]|uniref:c-type cytochrome n=1 Tax=Stappia sp. TSB10GB4 TaxID=2003584 RepID=UPI0016453C91|nr:cytochrome c [Stappia sp. TSB10GB4]